MYSSLDSTNISNNDFDDSSTSTQTSRIHFEIQKQTIESILKNKAHRYEYIKHVVQYPKIMEYIMNDNSDRTNIPLRYLEPFIKQHVR